MRKAIIIAIAVILLTSSCTPFRQPAPERQPYQQQLPNDLSVPDQNPQANSLAADIAERAREISGVHTSSAIVIGDLTIIGLQLHEGIDESQVAQSVSADIVRQYDKINTALIATDYETADQISAASDLISQGSPTVDVLDMIFKIWQKVHPE